MIVGYILIAIGGIWAVIVAWTRFVHWRFVERVHFDRLHTYPPVRNASVPLRVHQPMSLFPSSLTATLTRTASGAWDLQWKKQHIHNVAVHTEKPHGVRYGRQSVYVRLPSGHHLTASVPFELSV